MPGNRRTRARRSRATGGPGETALRLLNLGPKTSGWLRDIGITTRDELVRVDAVEACRRMRVAGFPVSILAAYALEGALMNVHWNALPAEFKRQLELDYRRMERATPLPPALHR